MGVERELVGALVVLHRKVESLLCLVYRCHSLVCLEPGVHGGTRRRIHEAQRFARGFKGWRVPSVIVVKRRLVQPCFDQV